MTKTIRLVFPEWQGGVNPNYYIGSKLLAWLVPENADQQVIEVPVAENFEEKDVITDGISWKPELMAQQKKAKEILEEIQPDKVIVLGGDCSVEQAPFDYLHGKYPEKTGIIWIDAHPDFSGPEDVSHEHAMVLGNLLGGGEPGLSGLVEHKFTIDDVMYAGLVADYMEPWETVKYEKYPIAYATPEDLKDNSDKIINWIKEKGFEQILIHWDLDVLSPKDFYSLLCNEPHISPVHYAVGTMHLEQVIRIIKDISETVNVVGLGITEFMPWDVIRMKKLFGEIEIFK